MRKPRKTHKGRKPLVAWFELWTIEVSEAPLGTLVPTAKHVSNVGSTSTTRIQDKIEELTERGVIVLALPVAPGHKNSKARLFLPLFC